LIVASNRSGTVPNQAGGNPHPGYQACQPEKALEQTVEPVAGRLEDYGRDFGGQQAKKDADG
jgi:hypothetical protein